MPSENSSSDTGGCGLTVVGVVFVVLLSNRAINLVAVVLLLVLGALGYLCIFHLK